MISSLQEKFANDARMRCNMSNHSEVDWINICVDSDRTVANVWFDPLYLFFLFANRKQSIFIVACHAIWKVEITGTKGNSFIVVTHGIWLAPVASMSSVELSAIIAAAWTDYNYTFGSVKLWHSSRRRVCSFILQSPITQCILPLRIYRYIRLHAEDISIHNWIETEQIKWILILAYGCSVVTPTNACSWRAHVRLRIVSQLCSISALSPCMVISNANTRFERLWLQYMEICEEKHEIPIGLLTEQRELNMPEPTEHLKDFICECCGGGFHGMNKKNKMKKQKNIHSVCVRRRGMPNTETETFSIHWIQYCVPQTIWIWIIWCNKTSRIWTIRIQWQTKKITN